ncbi:hypothetical protein T10_12840 [Trichinella papuae]|uniref:Uncharacterized protein n=1 Tax=Trichinella papuae TaxID=268474 RepID=A0A0V1LY75_9BILA|nr:hypothetical protein T10_12840 [Trichinella papuae]
MLPLIKLSAAVKQVKLGAQITSVILKRALNDALPIALDLLSVIVVNGTFPTLAWVHYCICDYLNEDIKMEVRLLQQEQTTALE